MTGFNFISKKASVSFRTCAILPKSVKTLKLIFSRMIFYFYSLLAIDFGENSLYKKIVEYNFM